MSRSLKSHQSARAKNTTWLTPPAVLDALGPFDLDPCSCLPRPWRMAKAHYYPPIDGLAAPWRGRVWLNPPFANPGIGAWLARLLDHGTGTAMIPAALETASFFAYVHRGAHAFLALEGRPHFHLQDGRRARANSGQAIVLVAYGWDDAERLAEAADRGEIPGAFYPILLPRLYVAAALGVTWCEAVREVLARSGGAVRLDDLYRALQGHAKARGRPHWRAKVRQTLQRGGFRRVGRGQWAAPEARAA